jgi:CDP-2,3-bis-(O-geranylgeranyl)-sn-glycerol synthase
MIDLWAEFVKALFILLPAYAANGFPPLARGKIAVDFKKKWFDKKRILGNGKTFEGFTLGLIVGSWVGLLEYFVYPFLNTYAIQFNVSFPTMNLFIGFIISFGSLFGDLAGSFIKRRFGLKRGTDVPLLDQWNFVIGAVLFGFWFTEITIWMFLLMLLITPLIHRIANIIAYTLKVKKEPW